MPGTILRAGHAHKGKKDRLSPQEASSPMGEANIHKEEGVLPTCGHCGAVSGATR